MHLFIYLKNKINSLFLDAIIIETQQKLPML